jgi:hypothetical protein
VVAAALNPVADSVGPGGTAAIVVFVLILATIAIFVGLLGSLKRLRQNAKNGTFHAADGAHEGRDAHQAAADQQTQSRQAEKTVTPDPGSGGAGA